MTSSIKSHRIWDTILFSLPFLIWFICFYFLYDGRHILFADAGRNFVTTNYFLNHLMQGEFPMWDPYNFWGRPDVLSGHVIAEFNPFLYICVTLMLLGLSFTNAYFIYVVTYFFVGMIGFYLLVNKVFGQKSIAYLALILLVFSTFGTNLFNDILIILMMVPGIWFFFFLIAFIQSQEKIYFVGLTFSLMILAVTYIPFYFLIVMILMLLGYCAFYFKAFIKFLGNLCDFISNNKMLVSICLLSLLLALSPSLLWYQSSVSEDFVLSWRDSGSASDAAAMPLKSITLSGITGPYSLQGLISDLDHLRAGSFYMPVFVYLILLLGLIVPVTRRQLLILFVVLVLFLISLADVTPVHRFLFEHVFFFKYFRNLHYLLWLAMPFMIVFFVEQFRLVLNRFQDKKKRIVNIVYIVVLHLGFFVFLWNQERIIATTFIVVILSLIYFMSINLSLVHWDQKWMLIFLLIIIIMQPLEVFYNLGKNSKVHVHRYTKNPYMSEDFKPKFFYMRPLDDSVEMIHDVQGFGNITDASGFLEGPYLKAYWTDVLYKNLGHDALRNYVKYKFLLYDKTSWLPELDKDNNRVEQAFMRLENIAFVPSGSKRSQLKDYSLRGNSKAMIIDKDTDQFKVVEFGLNKIKILTNFSEEKFLVYNDSFHRSWRSTINGRDVSHVRANIAFKGLWLPAGKNVVTFRFGSLYRVMFNYFLLALFSGFFIYFLYLMKSEKMDIGRV